MSEHLTELGIAGLALLVVFQGISVVKPMVSDWLRKRRRSSNPPPPPQGPREDTGRYVLDDLHKKVESLNDALGARPGRRSVIEEKLDRHEQLLQAMVENSRKQTQILESLTEEQKKVRKKLSLDREAS